MKVLRQSADVRQRSSGFSLVEVIVATAITVAVTITIISIVSNVVSAWSRASGDLRASNDVRNALDLLTRDLQSAVIRADGNVWLAATVQPDQTTAGGDAAVGMAQWTATTGGVTKPVAGDPADPNRSLELTPASLRLADYRFGMAGVWLRFFTIEPDTNVDPEPQNTSAVRGVAYQVVRHRVTIAAGSSLRYGLFRSWVRPHHVDTAPADRSVFRVGHNLFAVAYNSVAGGGDAGDASTIRQPTRNLLLANNVIDFGVRFWVRDPSSGDLRLAFPADSTGAAHRDNRGFAATTNAAATPPTPSPWAPPGSFMSYGFPEAAEVFIRVLTEQGARELEAFELNPIPGRTWWDVAIARSEVYTRTIEIKPRTL